jgi:hypothetical protein
MVLNELIVRGGVAEPWRTCDSATLNQAMMEHCRRMLPVLRSDEQPELEHGLPWAPPYLVRIGVPGDAWRFEAEEGAALTPGRLFTFRMPRAAAPWHYAVTLPQNADSIVDRRAVQVIVNVSHNRVGPRLAAPSAAALETIWDARPCVATAEWRDHCSDLDAIIHALEFSTCLAATILEAGV